MRLSFLCVWVILFSTQCTRFSYSKSDADYIVVQLPNKVLPQKSDEYDTYFEWVDKYPSMSEIEIVRGNIPDSQYDLSLEDGNNNGYFNDKEDYVHLIQRSNQYSPWGDLCSNSIQIRESMYLQTPEGDSYEIAKIDSLGREISLKYFKSPPVENTIFLKNQVRYSRVPFELIRSNSNTILKNLFKESSDYIIVNFWAKWCKPCIDHIPELNNISKELN